MSPPEEVIARVLGVSPQDLDDDSSPDTVEGWDSLAHSTLILEFETEYDVSVAPGDAMEMVDVRSIKAVLRDYGVSC